MENNNRNTNQKNNGIGLFSIVIGGFLILFFMLTFYLMTYYKDDDMRKNVYDLKYNFYTDAMLKNELAKAIEQYLSIALNTPNFDFENPVYYNYIKKSFEFRKEPVGYNIGESLALEQIDNELDQINYILTNYTLSQDRKNRMINQKAKLLEMRNGVSKTELNRLKEEKEQKEKQEAEQKQKEYDNMQLEAERKKAELNKSIEDAKRNDAAAEKANLELEEKKRLANKAEQDKKEAEIARIKAEEEANAKKLRQAEQDRILAEETKKKADADAAKAAEAKKKADEEAAKALAAANKLIEERIKDGDLQHILSTTKEKTIMMGMDATDTTLFMADMARTAYSLSKPAATALTMISQKLGRANVGGMLAKMGKNVKTVKTVKAAARQSTKFSSIGLKLMKSGMVGKKIAQSMKLFASQIGKRVSAYIAQKSAQKAAAKASLKATRIGIVMSKIGSKYASLASAGPPGWVAAVVSAVFDIVSLGLDLGDAGGYGMLDNYRQARNALHKQIKDYLVEMNLQGTEWPYEIGVLDKFFEEEMAVFFKAKMKKIIDMIDKGEKKPALIDMDDYNKATEDEKIGIITATLTEEEMEEYTKIADARVCAEFNGTLDATTGSCVYDMKIQKEQDAMLQKSMEPYLAKLNDALLEWGIGFVAANEREPSEAELGAKYDILYAQIPMKDLIDKNNINFCESKGGTSTFIEQKQADGSMAKIPFCAYKNEQSCNAHYTMEKIPETGEEMPVGSYTQWVNGKCMSANYPIVAMCKQNRLAYDPATGTCNITRELCKEKGAEYRLNEKTGIYDCYVPKGQKVFEFIFGETITRGFKQLFDSSLYEKCQEGEIDDGFFCRRVGCPPGTEDHLGMCYKVPDGWTTVGMPPGTMRKFCKPGFNFDTLEQRCERPKYARGSMAAGCPDGTINMGANCQRKSIGRGAGVTKSSKEGGRCLLWGLEKGKSVCKRRDAPAKFSESAGVADEVLRHANSWEECAGRYFPNCPPGTRRSNTDCVTCVTEGSNDMICRTKAKKESGGYKGPDPDTVAQFEKVGARCYPPCAAGYAGVVEECHDRQQYVPERGILHPIGPKVHTRAKKQTIDFSSKKK